MAARKDAVLLKYNRTKYTGGEKQKREIKALEGRVGSKHVAIHYGISSRVVRDIWDEK